MVTNLSASPPQNSILQAGAAKVFITSRKASACAVAVKQLNALPNLAPGATAISVPADISTAEGVGQLVTQVQQHTDHVDILLANAGASWGAPLDHHPDAAIAKVLDLNVRAVFNTIRDFAPLLRARATAADPSRVIITASIAGLGVGTLGEYATFGYAASKAAAISLGWNLAVELGPQHITVNNLAPSFFPSKMANGLLDILGGPDIMASVNPLRRLGQPEDIAGAVVYLCSRAGAYVNGVTLPLDGGASLVRAETFAPALAKL